MSRSGRLQALLAGTTLAGTALLPVPALAQDWTGAASTNWFTAGNWNPAAVPSAGQNVVIDTIVPNPTVIGAAGAVANSVSIGDTGGSTGRLTIQGAGTLTSATPVIVGNAGTGTLTVGTGGTLTVSGGTRTIEIAQQAGSNGTFNIGGAFGDPAVAPGTIDALAVQFGAGAGSLNFNHTSTSYSFTPEISGNGTVRFNAGTTLLIADSTNFTGTTTIANGATLQLGSNINFFGGGGETGSIGGAIVNNGALVVSRTDDMVLNGISGSGTYTQIGGNAGGVTTMNAVNTYTGATVVNGGTLLVNSSITSSSSVTVNGSGVLGGTGTVASTTINGTIAPGGTGTSIGTLTVAGNLTMNGTYTAETTPVSADRINVIGNVLLGGTVLAVSNGGSYAPGQLLLLNSAGRAGTFNRLTVDGNFSGLVPSLSYVGNNVFLNLAAFAGGTDAQWLANPGTNIFNTATNWNPATTPTGTATFGASTTTTITFAEGTVQLGRMVFEAGAPAYTFNVDTAGLQDRILNFFSEGIVNNAATRPTFIIVSAAEVGGSGINFFNASTAGNAQIDVVDFGVTRPSLNFYDTSSAANATINNQFGDTATAFRNSSTAANATINNGSPGGLGASTVFFDNSTAANATINNYGTSGVAFLGSSSAGNAQINNQSTVSGQQHTGTQAGVFFGDNSTAASATIVNNDGNTSFNDSATAANATIINSGASVNTSFFNTAFMGNSTAGNATIINSNATGTFSLSLYFTDNGTAASANITNNNAGITAFYGSSTAANATIVNNSGGSTQFFQTASAGNVTITNNSGGATVFGGNATANTATIVNNAGGAVDISQLTAAGITIGTLSGAGDIFLGSRNLTLPGVGGSATIGGVIADGGVGGGTGGSLTWTGAGTLTLTGNNTYTGATTINAGTLHLGNGGATGAVAGPSRSVPARLSPSTAPAPWR